MNTRRVRDDLRCKNEERVKEKPQPRPRAKSEEQNDISIHDQDTAEIEVPDSLRKDPNEEAA